MCVERLRELGSLCLKERQFKGNLTDLFNDLMEEHRQDRVKFFSRVVQKNERQQMQLPLTVYPLSYNTVASVRPHERFISKHGLSILSQMLGCSDIHHSWDQKAPENYQRAWRKERDIGSFHNEWGGKALSRLQVSQYFFMLSDTVW